MPIHANIITGFLGAGKTTAVLHLLDRLGRESRVAVLVNEFGKVGIDGEVLARRGQALDVVELPQGCICCTLRGDLMRALAEIAQIEGIERLLIEPTGVAQPADLVDVFSHATLNGAYRLGAVITVVDPAMLKKLAGRGMPFYDKQLELADVLAINKCDLAGAELLDWAEQELRSRNAAAAIVRTEHGRISETLLDAPSRVAGRGSRVPGQTVAKSDSEKSGTSKGRLRALGLDLSNQTYTLDAVRAAFTELCATPPAGIFVHRAKGLFRTDQGTYLVEIAGEAVHAREAETCAPRVDFVVELATRAELKSFEAAVREQLAACRMAALTDR